MALEIGTRLGAYEVLAQLGEGGMGEVYRATDTKLARTVALKVLSPALTGDAEYMARFTREAHILASFNHPNIAVIYGLEESGGTRALVMELIEGRNLAECIAAGAFGLEETLLIAKQIAEALEAAHDKGIVHRDLKPANVMLTPEGVVKVLDFGLAKQAETRTPSGDHGLSLTVRATQAGVVMGTAGYMSPEQAAAKPADRRADIWAFGVVLWEMLCRKPLFSGETIAHTLADVLRAEIDLGKLPAETPPVIRELIRRCLERDVKKRLQAIGEARIAIEKHLANPAPGVVETAPPIPVATRSHRLPWAMAALATIVALALGVTQLRQSPPTQQVIRFTIPVPDKANLRNFALSPDGRYVALVVDQGGQGKLWLRALDSLTSTELRGTEGANYPFWSPDSRTVGFFAGRKMKKITIEGGPAVILCDAPEGRGGTWNRDGVIVLAPSNNGGLHRVGSAGGVPVKITTPEGAAIHRFPVFLPDGQRFLFLSNLGDPAKEGIYAGSLDGSKPWRVTPDVSSAAFAPRNGGEHAHLLFLRQRTLMAQPVDEKSLRFTGDIFPVAEQVGLVNRNYAQMSVSANGTLVHGEGGNFVETQLTWMDRNGKMLGKVGSPSPMVGFAISPDGRTVALSRRSAQASLGDIWLHDLDRSVETRVTFSPNSESFPVWTSDGRAVVYSMPNQGLSMVDANGQKPPREIVKGAVVIPLDISKDGKTLLYMSAETKGFDLWLMPLDGDGKPSAFLATDFNETGGRFSPDGKWVAYSSDESGKSEIYVRPYPSGPGKWLISSGGGQMPRWSPDGKELYYVAPDSRFMAAAVTARDGAFAVGAIQSLFLTNHQTSVSLGQIIAPDVSKDGKRFLVSQRMGTEGLETPLTVVVNWLDAVKR